MKNKTISFLDYVDGEPVDKDINEMIELIRTNYNNFGIGNFIVKMYREWRTQKALIDSLRQEIESLKSAE